MHEEAAPRRLARVGLAIGNRQSAIGNERAFTMIEIALCLAVIGFAMVAILGVLPMGLQVQRENREETIINQDATLWLNALRAGAHGFDDLTNYVDAITNYFTDFEQDGTVLGRGRDGFDRASSDIQSILNPPFLPLTNGYRIIGLLGTPKYRYWNITNQIVARSNYVVAYVRAMSGTATEKFPQANPSVRELAFSYRLISEVVSYAQWDTNWVALDAVGLTAEEYAARSNHWWIARQQNVNLHDLRLTFRWPLLARGGAGNGRQVFRTLVSGVVSNEPPLFYFFNPRAYVRYP